MGFTAQIVSLFAVGAVMAGGVLGGDQWEPAPSGARVALVVDAAEARHGRALVHPRLLTLDAAIRLPRTPAEAHTNVQYFHALGYRLIVAGPRARAAAVAAHVPALPARALAGALAAVERAGR